MKSEHWLLCSWTWRRPAAARAAARARVRRGRAGRTGATRRRTCSWASRWRRSAHARRTRCRSSCRARRTWCARRSTCRSTRSRARRSSARTRSESGARACARWRSPAPVRPPLAQPEPTPLATDALTSHHYLCSFSAHCAHTSINAHICTALRLGPPISLHKFSTNNQNWQQFWNIALDIVTRNVCTHE